jgi:hypothetical protein
MAKWTKRLFQQYYRRSIRFFDQQELVAPTTDTERALATIWQDLLNVDSIGVNDIFFALGGHSLLIAQLVFQVKLRSKKIIPLKTLFENAKLKDLARVIENNKDCNHKKNDNSTVFALIANDTKTGALIMPL